MYGVGKVFTNVLILISYQVTLHATKNLQWNKPKLIDHRVGWDEGV